MSDSRKTSWALLCTAVLLISAVTACGPETTTPSEDEATAVALPTESEPATVDTEAPASIPLPTEPPPTPYEELTTEGCWWVIAAEEGIYAVKPDGSDLTKISDQVIYASVMGPFFDGAPNGGHLAYTQWDTTSDEETLYLLSPSSGETKLITSLSSAVGPIYQGDQFFEARQYISSEAGIAWSPNGQHLAFVGFIDGPTLDLYVYSIDDGSITRLTDGNTPALRPIWSPDGNLIAHHGVPGFLTGSGPTVDSLWVARADGSENRKLLDAEEDSQEEVLGWMDSQNLVIHSYDLSPNNLRTVNVETGSGDVLWKDYFSDVALNAQKGTLLLGVNRFAADNSPGVQQGLYLIQVGGAPAWRINEDEPEAIIWSEEAGLFFAKTELGILAVTTTGEYIDLYVPFSSHGFPIVAPGTRDLAWTSGLWVSTLTSGLDNPPLQIFYGPTYIATWGPQGKNLLFLSEGKIYVARSPEFSPVLMGEGVNVTLTTWVYP